MFFFYMYEYFFVSLNPLRKWIIFTSKNQFDKLDGYAAREFFVTLQFLFEAAYIHNILYIFMI